ncbi:MAG: LysR family transcriptional regulator [Clostridia bacterium]|nr:LysR family transcriptional regulator [Clostridia bacterium]MBQ4575386.1 LysR family transcriptional regulator [Clostridia bacterium]
MLDIKIETLLAVYEKRNFTKAAELLSLTQPAVSHHIKCLEDELETKLFIRGKGDLRPTPEGEIAVGYAKRFKAMYAKLKREVTGAEAHFNNLRIGITHTAESNFMVEVLAKFSNKKSNVSITVSTDTIKNLYDKLENYEIDLAIVEGKPHNPELYSIMLDTDYLVCVMSNDNPLAKQSMVTLNELKRERMILRLPQSATRLLFESTLESMNESIGSFNVTLEIDNIATIKDLIRKDLGVSILAKSACMDEVRKGKITVLPIENLSMVRETNIVYHKDFTHVSILKEITKLYQNTARTYL